MLFLIGMFVYSLFLGIVSPLFLSHIHIHTFVPFIILSFYRTTFTQCLWWTWGCSFIIELYTSDSPIGISAIPFCLTTVILYRYKFYFFEDRFSTLPIMSFLYSFLFTFFESATYYFYKDVVSDQLIRHAILIGIQNSFYCCIAFTLPFYLLSYMRKRHAISFLR